MTWYRRLESKPDFRQIWVGSGVPGNGVWASHLAQAHSLVLLQDQAMQALPLVHRNKARVIMPPMVYLVPPMRLLPVRLFDWVASFLGVNTSMDEFTGRQGSGPKNDAPQR